MPGSQGATAAAKPANGAAAASPVAGAKPNSNSFAPGAGKPAGGGAGAPGAPVQPVRKSSGGFPLFKTLFFAAALVGGVSYAAEKVPDVDNWVRSMNLQVITEPTQRFMKEVADSHVVKDALKMIPGAAAKTPSAPRPVVPTQAPVREDARPVKADVERTAAAAEEAKERAAAVDSAATAEVAAATVASAVADVKAAKASEPTTSAPEPVTPAAEPVVAEASEPTHVREDEEAQLSAIAAEKEAAAQEAAAAAAAAEAGNVYKLPPVTASEEEARRLRLEAVTRAVDEVQAQSAALRKEMEATLLKDLEKLDEGALRYRIAQLSAEFIERAKWEGLRLHQAVVAVRDEYSRRTDALLLQQRVELESGMKAALAAKEDEVREDASQRLREITIKHEQSLAEELRKATGELLALLDEERATRKHALEMQERELTDRHSADLSLAVAYVHESAAGMIAALNSTIDTTSARAEALEGFVRAHEHRKESAYNVHRVAAAAMALEPFLRGQSTGITAAQVDALRKACASDATLSAVLATVPAGAVAKGVPSLLELQARYQQARKEARKAALAPESAPGIGGQIVGEVLARVLVPSHGLVEGSTAEDAMTRAAYRVELGDIPGALRELGPVHGFTRTLLHDWIVAAEHRVACDLASRALRARASIMHSEVA